MQSINVIPGVPNTKPSCVRNFQSDANCPQFPQNHFAISGVTRDSSGNALAGCAVNLFETAAELFRQSATSDASGNFSFWVNGDRTFFLNGYKSGSPDVAGTTVNTLTGSTPGVVATITLNQGDLLNESFEGSVPAGWSSFGTGATWGDTSPGTIPFSNLGTKSLGCATSGANTAGYYYDFGSNTTATRYWRFYLYLDSTSQANNDFDWIFAAGETTTYPFTYQASVQIGNFAGQFQIYVAGPGGSSSPINISLATWYRIEIQTIYNGTLTLHVYDSSGNEISGSPGTGSASASNSQVRYAHFGIPHKDNSQDATFHIDGIGVSSTGYLGH